MDDSGLKLKQFVMRIISGEHMNTPEDLQFYMNNKSAIEELLRIYGDDQDPFNDIKDINDD
tara:strand:+ start:15715 stop:15897 length:183 start_codon:yes stop_codon:yes gene_type:complete